MSFVPVDPVSTGNPVIVPLSAPVDFDLAGEET